MAPITLCTQMRLYPGGQAQVRGTTSSGQAAAGLRQVWDLYLSSAQLPIWDTVWSTGEREIVLGKPDPVPTLPAAVTHLMGRRRASVETFRQGLTVMTLRLVLPDANDWPHFQSCTIAELHHAIGSTHLAALQDNGVLSVGTKADLLGSVHRKRGELCAVIDDAVPQAPSVAYVLTRVLPTLQARGLDTCPRLVPE